MKSRTTLYLDFLEAVGDNDFQVEGYLGGAETSLKQVTLLVSDKKVKLTPFKRNQSQDRLELHKPIPKTTFKASFSLPPGTNTTISAQSSVSRIRIKTNQFTGLANLCFSYKVLDNRLFTLRRGKITVYKNSALRHNWLEFQTNLAIIINWRLPRARQIVSASKGSKAKVTSVIKATAVVAEAIFKIPRALILRQAYFLYKIRRTKPIWLISDRTIAARDNGEAFFKYVMSQQDLPANVYFVISRKSPDYKRLKQVGPVVNYGSLRHLLLHLRADKVVSSHADIQVYNPFIRQVDRYLDLFSFDFVFLQHGIIRHDLSAWLNRYSRNIKLFVTSSEHERKRILTDDYYYDEKTVVLTGLPRFDHLKNQSKKKLVVMPAYRNDLVQGLADRRGERPYNSNFKQSEFYQFYNRLINDSKLLETMRDNDMTGEFYIHPMLSKQAVDFMQNPTFRVMQFPYDYHRAFSEGSLLITDYSSVVFDFAYMKKPLIYAQFDIEDFFKNRDYSDIGGFDDATSGFGPICENYGQLIDETIKSIESGLIMPAKYTKRVDDYFKFSDQGNSERVYRAILNLDKQGK